MNHAAASAIDLSKAFAIYQKRNIQNDERNRGRERKSETGRGRERGVINKPNARHTYTDIQTHKREPMVFGSNRDDSRQIILQMGPKILVMHK